MTAYDPDNIFAKILSGGIPCHKVFEDNTVLAFLDVMPQSRGHTLVIPKTGSRNLLDADSEVLAQTFKRVQTVARAISGVFKPDGLRIIQFNEEAAGQTVFHLHFHIIPVYDGVPLTPHTGEMAGDAELDADAKKLAAALS